MTFLQKKSVARILIFSNKYLTLKSFLIAEAKKRRWKQNKRAPYDEMESDGCYLAMAP